MGTPERLAMIAESARRYASNPWPSSASPNGKEYVRECKKCGLEFLIIGQGGYRYCDNCRTGDIGQQVFMGERYDRYLDDEAEFRRAAERGVRFAELSTYSEPVRTQGERSKRGNGKTTGPPRRRKMPSKLQREPAFWGSEPTGPAPKIEFHRS